MPYKKHRVGEDGLEVETLAAKGEEPEEERKEHTQVFSSDPDSRVSLPIDN